ncbi:MAG: hypothetical protein EAZ09_15475 [Oscillatoriales cyanobacterium]|nr:MAG: hypothetical protein EAZ18_15005 [Oscillatoriales cyanobacterium]TAH19779.1 MAG: hypothetical protein EAZ09_15475 [Oscillatoriales cyanobacterium]
MILNRKSLEKLRNLINEETKYRKGQELVQFFNALGFSDSYGQGFPSRWRFTDERLSQLNDKPKLDECIRNVLSPANFIGRIVELDKHIAEFNQYIAFDKWKVVRDGAKIGFAKLQEIEIDETATPITEDEFLKREFSNISIAEIGLESVLSDILQQRIMEIEQCFSAGAYLSVILLAGSTLEGILLGLAKKHPKKFNTSKASPKDTSGKVKEFHDWSLSCFIDVAKDINLIQHDTQKFSHSLRDFRNYIHPFEQMRSGFNPRQHTAKICLQVLKNAIHEINESVSKIST